MRWGRIILVVAVLAVLAFVVKPWMVIAGVAGVVLWLVFGHGTGRFTK